MADIPDNLSKEEADELLKKLARVYHEPVMPVSKYCKAISTWFRCIEEANENKIEVEHRWPHGEDYYKKLRHIELDILKSNLLYRLIYLGQPLRTDKCPRHKGKWSGIGHCPYGCEDTGWLPNSPEEREKCSWVSALIVWEDEAIIKTLPDELCLMAIWEKDPNHDHMPLKIKFGNHFENMKKSYAIIKFASEDASLDLLERTNKFDVLVNGKVVGKGEVQL